MSGGGGGDGKTPTLNVVSMVDVIFNVIVFFIITAKAANEEMVKLVVPKVDSPALMTLHKDNPRLVVSVLSINYDDKVADEQMKEIKQGHIADAMAISSGQTQKVRIGKKDIRWPAESAELIRMIKAIRAERTQGMSEADARKKFEVLLRADLALPYKEVRPVMNAISAAGVENVNLMAFKE